MVSARRVTGVGPSHCHLCGIARRPRAALSGRADAAPNRYPTIHGTCATSADAPTVPYMRAFSTSAVGILQSLTLLYRRRPTRYDNATCHLVPLWVNPVYWCQGRPPSCLKGRDLAEEEGMPFSSWIRRRATEGPPQSTLDNDAHHKAVIQTWGWEARQAKPTERPPEEQGAGSREQGAGSRKQGAPRDPPLLLPCRRPLVGIVHAQESCLRGGAKDGAEEAQAGGTGWPGPGAPR